MAKFKVGDKAVLNCNYSDDFTLGTKVKIISTSDDVHPNSIVGIEKKNGVKGSCLAFRLDPIESKPTKNQRITALEKEVAELKVIVHQLRKPSTEVQEAIDKARWERGEVEGVIQFEGQNYRKVDREAREGDVVIYPKLHESWHDDISANKIYAVYEETRKIKFKDDAGDSANVYGAMQGYDDIASVKVYELIAEDKQPPLLTVAGETRETTYEEIAQMVSEPNYNQLRAEIIEKAKGFIENVGQDMDGEYWLDGDDGKHHCTRLNFIVNEEKRTIVAIMRGVNTGVVRKRGIAKCNPSDVYNEHIGRAIALGRALSLDVSEFEQAVQPTEVVVGHVVETFIRNGEHHKTFEVGSVTHNHKIELRHFGRTRNLDFTPFEIECGDRILNDTNAQYSKVVE